LYEDEWRCDEYDDELRERERDVRLFDEAAVEV